MADTSGAADAADGTGASGGGQTPPLRVAPGTVLPPLIAGGLVVFALTLLDDPSEAVHYSVVSAVVAGAVVARWKLPPYRTRLPARAQIPLVIALLVVTVPLLLDGTLRLTHLLLLSALPPLFPALIPEEIRQQLIARREERRRRYEEQQPAVTGPTWQDRQRDRADPSTRR